MKGMEIGHGVWQGEGNKRSWVWAKDNIKVDIKEDNGEASIWLRTVRSSGLKKYFDELWVAIQHGKFLD